MAKLSKEDHEKLQRAITEAEHRSGVHLALVVVPVSDRYVTYPLAYGALFALGIGGALALIWPELALRTSFVLQAFSFAVFSVMFEWLPLRMTLVPAAIRRIRTHNLAHREFAARILTTHRGGLLLFVSLGERAVELLADRQIHARIGQEVWNRIVRELTASARTKPLTECLLTAIASCGDALEASTQKAD